MQTRQKISLPLLILLTLSLHSSSFSDDILRKKIAQMFILGFNGTTLSDTIRADLAARGSRALSDE